MKILVVHPGESFSVSDVYAGWVEAFTKIAEVRTFDLHSRLVTYSNAKHETADGFVNIWTEAIEVAELCAHDLHGVCFQYRPDIVFVISARLLPLWAYDMIRRRGLRVVMLHTESPYEDDDQLINAQHADLNLINDPTNIEAFREIGPVAYVPHAYRPELHHPGPSEWNVDFSWVGTAGDIFPTRTQFLEAVDFGGATVALAGSWQNLADDSPIRPYLIAEHPASMIDNTRTIDLYRGSKMSMNTYRGFGDNTDDTFDHAWAMGPREVELAATGTFFARHSPEYHGGEGDELLPMLPTFTTSDELSEIIAYYLANPEAREHAARQARAAVADRTFDNHAQLLLGELGVLLSR